MPNVRVSHEGKRGCGYRKPGGLYLVSGALTAPCGKLPIEMHVCRACGGGIKPQRAWQWIMPRLLFSGAECHEVVAFNTKISRVVQGGAEACALCPLGGMMPERGGLLWIGGAYYKAAEDFMREARTMGISRRIPAVPRGFEPGKTVVYLAHREVQFPAQPCDQHHAEPDINCKACQGLRPGVFSGFIPRAIEYVVKGTETDDELAKLEAWGIEPVKVVNPQGELFEETDEEDDDAA